MDNSFGDLANGLNPPDHPFAHSHKLFSTDDGRNSTFCFYGFTGIVKVCIRYVRKKLILMLWVQPVHHIILQGNWLSE